MPEGLQKGDYMSISCTNALPIQNSMMSSSLSALRYDSSDTPFEIGNATKETTSSDDGKRIGLMTVDSTVYLATYADSSTRSNPVVKVGDYEININDVDPKNATELEMFAYLSYMDDTNQTNNTGICSFGKMRAYAHIAEMSGICSGILDSNAIYTKKQDWTQIIQSIKQNFLQNPQTYKQALDCDNLLFTMSKAHK